MLNDEQKKIKEEVRERTVGYIGAAFGLVAGLAWNEAIKSLIEYLYPFSAESLAAKFLYATLVTVIVVVITMYLSRILKRSEGSERH